MINSIVYKHVKYLLFKTDNLTSAAYNNGLHTSAEQHMHIQT